MNEIKTRFQVPPLQVRDRVTVFAGNQGKTGAPGLCDRESEGVGGSQRESEGVRGPCKTQHQHVAPTGAFPGPQAKCGLRVPRTELHSGRRLREGRVLGRRPVGAQAAHRREHPSPEGWTGAL